MAIVDKLRKHYEEYEQQRYAYGREPKKSNHIWVSNNSNLYHIWRDCKLVAMYKHIYRTKTFKLYTL